MLFVVVHPSVSSLQGQTGLNLDSEISSSGSLRTFDQTSVCLHLTSSLKSNFSLSSPSLPLQRHHPSALRGRDHQAGPSPEKSMRWRPPAPIFASRFLRSDQLTNRSLTDRPRRFRVLRATAGKTKTPNPLTSPNQSDHSDVASTRTEGRREKQIRGEET